MTDYKETYLYQIKQLEDKVKLLEKDNEKLTQIIVDGKKARSKLLLDGIIFPDYNKKPANNNAIW